MKLYTKVGDDGGTVLFDGTRVWKCDARVAAYGEVDELNAVIGVAVSGMRDRTSAAQTPDGLRHTLTTLIDRMTLIQHALFDIGAELATPSNAPQNDRIKKMGESGSKLLEGWIDEACAPVPELRTFILPGGDSLAANLHVCRTVCRRSERAIVSLARVDAVNPGILIYLNRLSDLFFAWSRLANHAAGVPDVEWHP
ncbi:MAG: cob(I)yrinic acid a,c-diamide adenosyltransferase [Phycisphaerae bacterium]|nr:cob(I)yrinic acid a,c-diamide adenosyltransferase [Phycisphaerae bacterium]